MKKLMLFLLASTFGAQGMFDVLPREVQDVQDACSALEACVRATSCPTRLKTKIAQQLFIGAPMWSLGLLAPDLAKKIPVQRARLDKELADAQKGWDEDEKKECEEKKKQLDDRVTLLSDLAKMWRESCGKHHDTQKSIAHGLSQEKEDRGAVSAGERGVAHVGAQVHNPGEDPSASHDTLVDKIAAHDAAKTIGLTVWLREMGDQVLEESSRDRNAIDRNLYRSDLAYARSLERSQCGGVGNDKVQ